MESPKFKSICDRCVFLGGFVDSWDNAYYDLYFHATNTSEPELIVKYGDGDAQYKSGFGKHGHVAIQECYRRAVERKLIVGQSPIVE